ncbi:phage major capsid protein [Candidatus Nanopelagicales bacterium]|nr:phage major capsid protein [Candidatus Nanopelagicales bacterium]
MENTMHDYLQQQIDARQSAWHAAKALLDSAAAENRDLTGEEHESYDRMMADIDERGQKIKDLQVAEQRSADMEAALAAAPEVRTERAEKRDSDADILRKLVSGEIRSHTFERRDLNKSDDSSIVPSAFLDSLQASLVTVGPMMDTGIVTLLNTASGEDLTIPTESTRPAATAIAEATEISALDPTFSSITLKAQKVAVLTKVSKELLTDSGISLEAYLGSMMGTSLGIKINNLLTVGTGTAEPNGIVTAAGSGITGGTAVSGAFTADNLIDLAHSVDGAYVRRGGGWMMRRASIGAVRKLQDGAGNYLFVPAATVGSPDTLLGYPIHDNPDVAAVATSAKSVLFGWFGSYHVRQVGGIEIARSDDAYFAYDQIGFRATMRIWGDLGQSAAVKYFAGNAA